MFNTDKNKVGLGTFPLAGVFKPITKEDAKNLVRTFLDNGGYYIDTAPVYGMGYVEELLGEVLKEYPRESYYLITKCGYIGIEDRKPLKSGKYSDVVRECEKSLKRLGLDYIDLYFSHSPDSGTPFDETVSALSLLQEQGKIEHIGVSNVNLAELKEYNKTGKVEFIQNRFSLLNRSIDRELEDYMLENNILLVPYQVIDRGQLTGKVFENLDLKDGDLRKGRSDWEPFVLEVISGWVKENLSPIAKRLGITLGQLSVAWALNQKFVGFVVVGSTNKEYILVNLKADKIKLQPEELKQIDAAYRRLESIVRDKYGKSLREFRGLNEKYY